MLDLVPQTVYEILDYWSKGDKQKAYWYSKFLVQRIELQLGFRKEIILNNIGNNDSIDPCVDYDDDNYPHEDIGEKE